MPSAAPRLITSAASVRATARSPSLRRRTSAKASSQIASTWKLAAPLAAQIRTAVSRSVTASSSSPRFAAATPKGSSTGPPYATAPAPLTRCCPRKRASSSRSVRTSDEAFIAVSYTHLRAHETPEHLVCRLLLEKKKKKTNNNKYHN